MKVGKVDAAALRRHAGHIKRHSVRISKDIRKKAFSSPKRIAVSTIALVVAGLVLAQVLYPTDTVVPFTTIDTVSVGGMKKAEAVGALDATYAQASVPIYFSDDQEVKVSPTFAQLGIEISNADRVYDQNYSWYLRLVPTSLFWYGSIADDGSPGVVRNEEKKAAYTKEQFGTSCKLAPINATVASKDGTLVVVPSVSGGTCDHEELQVKLAAVEVVVQPAGITVSGNTTLPAVSDESAEKERERIVDRIGDGIVILVDGKSQTIPKATVYEWITYSVDDDKLVAGLDAKKADAWLGEAYGAQLAVAAGVSTVTTRDFLVISQQIGKSGRAIDTRATRDNLEAWLAGGDDPLAVASKSVAPTVTYKRSYSPTDTGLSALMKHYAETNPGTYGVSLVELSGAHRNAHYSADTQFTTASTYKLFVAYSTLLKVEAGDWKWTDQIQGGRDLSKCFDDMIVLSDNACASTLLEKIGFKQVTEDANKIGATKTSFMGSDGIKSTARDEALFLSSLHSGQVLTKQASRDRLINAMKRNVFRQGVPAGLPGVTVANKVGFLDGLLHDASIVYSPSGTYVLVILTDKASWANIAELTKQLEALRG